MAKILRTLFAGLALSLYSTSAWPQASNQYLLKMDSFLKITNIQTTEFKSFIRDFQSDTISQDGIEKLHAALDFQKQVQEQEVEKLKSLYSKIFIERIGSKDDRKALVYQESNLSIATQRHLELLKSFIEKQEGQSQLNTKALQQLAQETIKLSSELKDGKSISVPVKMGLGQVFQASQSLTSSACKLIGGLCVRRSLSEIMDSLNEKNFLRNNQAYQYLNVEKVKQELAKNQKAVFILIGNHDQPLMDIALARKVALKLGSDQHITMTRKSVYPIPPPQSAGDVVFVVDNDPKSNPVQESLDILTKNVLSQDKSIVSLAVYPEGMLPYTGGQMPMTVKEGAFVIARKMAIQLESAGIPVYLVQMKTNIIEHLTATTDISPRVNLEFIEKVPTTPIDKSKGDIWIDSKRLQAEESFNSHRGKNQMDIFNLDKAPRSKIPYGIEMRKCSKIFLF